MNRETLQNSAGLRVAIIAGLTLVLCIPALFIQFLIYERENRQVEAVREVTAKWGESQYLTGPVLSVPVLYEKKQTDGTINKIKRLLYVLPGDFSVAGHLYPEMRYRGIYQILLYNSDLQFSGNFILPSKEELDLEGGTLQLHEALLEFGISDPAGISDRIEIKWNDAVFEAKPGIRNCNTIKAGFHTNSPIDEKSDISTFQFSTRIKGSERLSVTPVGEETTASLSGKWSHPSFTGDFLPHIRKIDENQFSAEWKILNLNRNFPHYSMVSPIEFDKTNFGVKLINPVDHYQKTTRTVKYAILFIGLTFLSYFLIEILNKKVLHPIQYLLIGSALVIFYLVLLSLSEHLPFVFAYLLSSLAMIGLISFYTRAIFKSTRFSVMISAILILLYGFLYINIQLQDYALLFGSLGLFLVLAIVMYITRHFDWYHDFRSESKAQT